MPITPISVSASFTSSSLNGLMMASTFFISYLLEDGEDESGHVRADALQVGQYVEMDLGRLERFGEHGAQAVDVRVAHLPLELAHERTQVKTIIRQRAVGGGEDCGAVDEVHCL